MRFLLFLVFLAVSFLSAQNGSVTAVSSNVAILLFSSAGEAPRSLGDANPEGLRAGQLLYKIERGEVLARLRVIRILPPQVEAEIVSGSLRVGDSVALSMGLSYQNLFSSWDLARLVAYYRAKVLSRDARRIDLEVKQLQSKLGFEGGDDLQTTSGMRSFLSKVYFAIGKKSPWEKRTYEKYFLLLYRYFILEEKVDGLTALLLDGEVGKETRPEVLYFQAYLFQAAGDFTNATNVLIPFIEKEKTSTHYDRAVLMLAQCYESLGKLDTALQYTKSFTGENRREGVWEEANFLRYRLYLKLGKAEESLRWLKEIEQDTPSISYLSLAMFWEWQTLRGPLKRKAEADKLREVYFSTHVDSPVVPEIKYLETQKIIEGSKAVKASELWLDLVSDYPDTVIGKRSFDNALVATVTRGDFGELAQLLDNYKKVFPIERELTSSLPSLIPALMTELSNQVLRSVDYTFPMMEDAYFYGLLEDSYSNFEASSAKRFSKYSSFNQLLAYTRKLLEPVVLQPNLYDVRLVTLACGALDQIGVDYAKDKVWYGKYLRRYARVEGFPDAGKSLLEFRNFISFLNSDILFAEKSAIEVLRLNGDSRHVDRVLAYFTDKLKKSANPLEEVLNYQHILDVYGRMDLRVEELHRLLRSYEKTPEYERVLREGRAVALPERAIRWNAANAFDTFDLPKDFRTYGTTNRYLRLKVDGKQARIESRLLSIDSRDYRVMQIRLKVDDPDAFDRGELWWETWEDDDWNPKKKIPFTFLGHGDVLVEIPLNHELWKRTIRRLRINFYAERFPSLDTSIDLQEITLF